MNKTPFPFYYVIEYSEKSNKFDEYSFESDALKGDFSKEKLEKVDFMQHLLTAFYKFGQRFDGISISNPQQYFKAGSLLRPLFINAFSPENNYITKRDFENLKILIQHENLEEPSHRLEALEQFAAEFNINPIPTVIDIFVDPDYYKYESPQKKKAIPQYFNEMIDPRQIIEDEMIFWQSLEGLRYELALNKISDSRLCSPETTYLIVYEVQSLLELLLIWLNLLFESKNTIKFCESCGLPYLASRRDYKYCGYDGQTCRATKQTEKDEENKKKSTTRLFRNIYARFYNKHNTSKTESDEWNLLQGEFSDLYQKYKYEKHYDEDTLLSWLNDVDDSYKHCNGHPFDLPKIEDD